MKNLISYFFSWYFKTVSKCWKREIQHIRGKKNDKWFWIILCVGFTLILLPIMVKEAFTDSFLLGVSFIWASMIAVSFAYILRNPAALIIIYIGVIYGREVTSSFLGAAKDEFSAGNLLGTAIVIILGLYLISWANRIKKVDI